MKKQLILIICGMLLLAATPAFAGMLFAVNADTDTLVSINPNTLAYTNIGSLGVGFDFGGLAYNRNSSIMYMIPGRVGSSLYTVNPGTGAASLIGSHGVTDLFGLAYDTKNNVLYGTQFSGGSNLYALDTLTGSATLIGNMGHGIGGLTYDSKNDRLIGMEDGYGDIYVIDRGTAGVTLLYNGDWVNDSGLAYDSESDLFWDIDWSGYLYSYDPNNGYARSTRLSGLSSHDGLTFVGNPSQAVPEPATILLFAVGAVGTFARRLFA